MPAGKMILAAKARRRYRRRASGFKKAVSTIARKVVMRQAETKTGSTAWVPTFGSAGTFLSVNGGGLWSSVVQGAAQQNREGDVIKSMGFKIRGTILADSATITAGRELLGLRVLICTGKRPLTSGDMPTFRGTIDPDVITVISDRYYTFTSDNLKKFFNMYVKFPRRIQYSGNVAIKNDAYIWVVPSAYGTGLGLNTGYVGSIEFQTYFKDI